MIMNREYGNAERYADEAVKLARGSSSIYYYSMNCKAQLAEEIGRLNEGLRIYAETEKRLLTDKTAFMQKYDFRIGIIGIYLKRMELPSAKEFLDPMCFLPGIFRSGRSTVSAFALSDQTPVSRGRRARFMRRIASVKTASITCIFVRATGARASRFRRAPLGRLRARFRSRLRTETALTPPSFWMMTANAIIIGGSLPSGGPD